MAIKHADKNGVCEMNPHLEQGTSCFNKSIVTDTAGH